MTLSVVDVEAAAVAYLHGSSALSAAGCQRVSTDAGPPYPMVRLVRTGGPSGRRLDQAAVQLDVFGPPGDLSDVTKATLSLICRTALAELDKWSPTSPPAVSWVRHLSSLAWLPDGQTSQGRFTNSLVVFTHS